MKTTALGNTGIDVSGICLGTAVYGSRIDDETSMKCLDAYYEQGGRFIDTANKYAVWIDGCRGGESETVIGKWMKERKNRDEMFIATKLGYYYGEIPTGLTAQLIESECEKSLKKLQIDCIDILYAHCDDRNTPLTETLGAFDRLIRAGKVRCIGCSNTRAWRIAEALQISENSGLAKYCCVQQRHSYFRPRPNADFENQPEFADDDLFDLCKAKDITLVAYSALLGGCYDPEGRARPANYAGEDSDRRLEALRRVAQSRGVTGNQLVLAWMQNSSPQVIPVTSGSKPEQITANLAAADLTLCEDEMQMLDNAGI